MNQIASAQYTFKPYEGCFHNHASWDSLGMLTDLLQNVIGLCLEHNPGQGLPLLEPQRGCHNGSGPFHEMAPFEVKQDKLVWWYREICLLLEDAVQGVHYLTPMANGCLHFKPLYQHKQIIWLHEWKG